MRDDSSMTTLLAALLAASAVGAAAEPALSSPAGRGPDRSSMHAASVVFSDPTRITNPWLPLSAIPVAELRGTNDGKRTRRRRRLLSRTEAFRIGGRNVAAAVVEDRTHVDGVLREVAFGYYAQADDGTVFYLGEDIDLYGRTGRRVVSHEGAFRYGRDTGVLGVAMPARPREGMRYTFEEIPGQGLEFSRVVDTNGRISVRAGAFHRVLEVHGLLLPGHAREVKWYARGVGLVKEQGSTGAIELVARG